MKSRSALVLVCLAIAGLTLVAAWLGNGPAVSGSAMSRKSGGWLAARRYLEARGARVALIDSPDDLPDAVLVVALPWQRFGFQEDLGRLNRRVLLGGTLVLAYSGSELSLVERRLSETLGFATERLGEDPPLHPLRWREAVAHDWSLRPEAGAPVTSALSILPLRSAPQPDPQARVLYRAPGGEAIVFETRRGRGRVFVLPAEVFSNARLAQPGHADLLENLLRSYGNAWAFDEYHHGLSAPAGADDVRLRGVMDLYLVHVGLIYLLALLAFVRRFGPTWHEPPVVAGSAGTFLTGLGALHDRLGHHAAAARLLAQRAQEFDPRLSLPEQPARAQTADSAGFLAWAQDVGRAQSKGASV